jgi:iron complex outermembrane receptor protein
MRKLSLSRVRLLAAVAVCSVALLGTSQPSTAKGDPTFELNIPAQDLGGALQAFGAAVNDQVLYSRDVVEGLRSTEVKGEFTSNAAIQILLKGSGVHVERTASGVLLIGQPSSAHPEATRAGDGLHSADTNPTDKEGRKSSPDKFRLAEVDQEVRASSAAVEKSDAGASEKAPEVVVTGYRFLDEDTSGTTNLPLPIEEVPQSISLVNTDFIKAADLKSIGEIAQYTAGAFFNGDIPSYGTTLELRGFSAGYAIDGLTVGDYIAEPDAATLERLEIVKGPSSVVYGAATPGGLVNLVSKSAAPNTPSYVEALGGSWGRWRIEGQAAGALNGSGTIRGIAVGAHEEANSFIDFVDMNKSVAYGGLNFDLADNLTGFARASYERLKRTAYDGVVTYPDGSLPPVGYGFFIGARNLDTVSQATRANAGLSWKVSNAWSLDLTTVFQYTTHGGDNPYGIGLQPNGDFTTSSEHYLNWNVTDLTLGVASILKLDDIGLTDSFISTSVRYQYFLYKDLERFPDFQGNASGTANIFSGDQAISNYFLQAMDITTGPIELQYERLRYFTGSTQANVKVASWVTLLGGLSYSAPTINVRSVVADPQTVANTPWENFNPGHQISYRGALSLEPVKGLNVYGSYSESFQPQLLLDINNDVLPPLTGKQYEVGAKYISPDRRLLLTAALFDIRQANQGEFDPRGGNENRYIPIGEVRHRGLELEATGQLTHQWQIKGGVALLDPQATKDTDPSIIGKTQPWLPKTTASLYTSYSFRHGITFGGGARFVSSVRTAYDGSTRDIPSYSLFDSSLSYSSGAWLLQLNAKNIFDQHYYIGTWQTLYYGINQGEPRSFAVSVRRDF